MYIYVRVMPADQYAATGADAGSARIKARLEQASGEPCLIVQYEQFSLSLVEQFRPRAIAMSGFGNHWQTYPVASFLGMDEVLHEANLPIICFCGSHQLLGFSFSRDLAATALLEDEPMRLLAAGEEPMRASGGTLYDLSRYFVADGFFHISRVVDDPLFAGLADPMVMRCSHYCEVKALPPGFVRLASSAHCPIEAMRHPQRPLYGTQFHPEAYDAPHLDGQVLLRNFAAIVEDFWRQRQ